MNRRLFVGVFENEEDILGATEAARIEGLRIVDVHTPYAVHGLDRAMGLRPSRLSRACLALGLFGLGVALLFQFWTTAVDWPINVGGRPWNSWPAFVPVAFEMMVLCAGLGVVLTLFLVCRLYPGKRARVPNPYVSDDQFVLILEESDATFDVNSIRRLLWNYHAVETSEWEDQERASLQQKQGAKPNRRLNIGLVLVLLVMVGLNWFVGSDPARPNREFLPDMVHSARFGAFADNPNFADGKTLQTPEPGTIARGQMPLHLHATPEDAVRAGLELQSPIPVMDAGARQQGAWVFANYCAVCHGPAAKGDGPVTRRGVPPPPSLLADKTRNMKDGQLFHVLTYGQANMASYAGQLTREQRWQAILHVRELQKQAEGERRP
jgi:mono/diheme cytochrome c family protein